MQGILTHNGHHLSFTLQDASISDLHKTTFWKVKAGPIKAMNPTETDTALIFSPNLSTAQCAEVKDCLAQASRWGVDMLLDGDYQNSVQNALDELTYRAERGLAIKQQNQCVQQEYADYKHVVDEKMVRKLRRKQMWDSFFMYSMRRSANFSVPGSGKTSSVLGTYAYLHAMGHADRVVVLCPKNAFDSWRAEWSECFGKDQAARTLCFDDERWQGIPTDARSRELTFGLGKYDLVTINYEASSLINALRDGLDEKTLLVYDEVHKIKSITGKRAKAAVALAKYAPYVIALTGTPIPNSYQDIYNLLHILYPRSYDWYFGFTPSSLKKPDMGGIERINQSIQPFFCRTNKLMLDVPAANEDKIISATASHAETRALGVLRDNLGSDPLALIIRILQLESDASMLNDAIPETDLEWIVDAEDVDASDNHIKTAPVKLPKQELDSQSPTVSRKTTACIELAQQLISEGKNVIIWCIFRKSMENLSAALERHGIRTSVICGSTPLSERNRILNEFKDDECGPSALITNPHTLAESVSLHTTCHDAIYFELSYNLVHLLQSKDRINRLGLAPNQYTQYYFLQTVFPTGEEGWSLDRNIYERLHEKERIMLDAIDRGWLELGSSKARDLDYIFDGFIE